ncbi:MAG: Bax inhibitor-1/YccA family protein [Puniceicoccales bacterium]|jgi:uncharacterized YccA/Bax inhibitor family protein|nr:Bax inhibitor-1/YccA family protein [Puniceicoccales bacterium]
MRYQETTNPVLREGAFRPLSGSAAGDAMTVRGTWNRVGVLFAIVVAAAIFSWIFPYGDMRGLGSKLALFTIAGFVLALVTMFRREWAPYTAPAYAVAEGLVMGSLSRLFDLAYPGVVVQAVALTLGIFASLFFLYRFQILRVTDRMRRAVAAATLGICLVYLVGMLVHCFGGTSFGFLHQPTPFSILFSLFVVAIAAFNLVISFDFIDQIAKIGAPRHMEWYAAFGLIVSLIWLYVEVLNLLAKLRRE